LVWRRLLATVGEVVVVVIVEAFGVVATGGCQQASMKPNVSLAKNDDR